jgi:error-prone DNA polymerase
MLKIDVLALGMLTCVRKAFELLRDHYGLDLDLDLARVPGEDPAVYGMLSEADSIGVFQVESRAQMSMLPRLRPRCFYDLVIEVAIVRPGPIQGNMVHPYLRRREGKEPVDFPSDALREVLGRTLGVPLFQEQAMRIAIVAAGFTPAQADGLRRAMAAFRRDGHMERYRSMLIDGMTARGYTAEFAERCFDQIRGFGSYGFPESHAASFAHLVYVSAWLKCHYPDAFCAALLNSQPMGFYAAAQLVGDAREHGVEVRPPDVAHSDWDCTLELQPLRRGPLRTALRLGLRQIKGLGRDEAMRIVAARQGRWRDMAELQARSGATRATLVTLAEADAFRSSGLDRRQALWAAQAIHDGALPLVEHAATAARPGRSSGQAQPGVAAPAGSSNQRAEPTIAAPFDDPAPLEAVTAMEPRVELPEMGLGEHVIEDYTSLRLSLKAHPLALLREPLEAARVVPAQGLASMTPGRRVTVAGLVLVRQRPGSAKGVLFVTLEDETGIANAIVWPSLLERSRAAVMAARLLAVTGRLQREGRVIHVMAERLADWTGMLSRLRRDAIDPAVLDGALSRADEARRATCDLREAVPDARNFR